MKTFVSRFVRAVLLAAMLTLLVSSSSLAETEFNIVDDTAGEDLGIRVSMAITSDGLPVIAYAKNSDAVKIAVCSNATCSNINYIKELDTSLMGGATDMSLALATGVNPRVSYYDNNLGDLKVAVCSNCSSGATLTTVDSTGDVGGGNSIAINGTNPVISYYDYTNDQVKIAVCSNYTCSAAKTITVIETFSGNVSGRTSLSLNANGYPVISYFDDVNDDLKLAVCGDATCTSKTIQTIDSTGYVGYDSSLKLNSNGYPVIAYRDTTNSALKIAVCGNANCTSKTVTTVSNDGSDGLTPSLALDENDYPIIAYENDTLSSELRLIACKDVNCTNKYVMEVRGGVYNPASLVLDATGKPVIAFQDYLDGDVLLAKVTKTDPVVFIMGSSVVYNGSPQAANVVAANSGGIQVHGTVSNVRYNGSTTIPTNPGVYAVTANFTPDDILNYNSMTNVSAGNFEILAVPPEQEIINGGLNKYAANSPRIPKNWAAGNFAPTDGKNTTAIKEGAASIKIAGVSGVTKTFSQVININGTAGDTFNFSYWVKGSALPTTGLCRGQVIFYNGNTMVQNVNVNCPTGTFGFRNKTSTFDTTSNFTKILVKFTFSKPSGYVWFDWVSLIH